MKKTHANIATQTHAGTPESSEQTLQKARIRSQKPNPMTMVEIVMALALFAAISAGSLTFINYLDSANAKTIRENAAIAVFDNTIERLSALPKADIETIKRVLADELKQSPLNSANLATSEVRGPNNGVVELVILDKRKKVIESIKRALPEKGGHRG
ncbi:MAG: hypothetical protein GXP32_04180 [Kiritimatiellaeota bacterium]|nr:hypothetical protein [Kiritimatiellota bacterium]